MLVTNIQHFSLDDGPGIRTVVFMAGCNLKCQWCHNPEMVYEKAIEQTAGEMKKEALFEEIYKDMRFYERSNGGVTFSGGEPILQRDELKELLQICKKYNIHTAIETAGNYSYEYIEPILEVIDYIIIDCKSFSEDSHLKYTGQSNRKILNNIKAFSRLNKEMIVRIPVVWGINIIPEELKRIGEFLASIGIHQVELMPYHRLGVAKYEQYGLEYPLREQEEPTEEQMNLCKRILVGRGVKVV